MFLSVIPTRTLYTPEFRIYNLKGMFIFSFRLWFTEEEKYYVNKHTQQNFNYTIRILNVSAVSGMMSTLYILSGECFNFQ